MKRKQHDCSEDNNENDKKKNDEPDKIIKRVMERHSQSSQSSMFNCVICSDYLVQPCTLLCGHNFCKECILEWIETKGRNVTCPTCRTPVKGKKYIKVNNVLESVINENVNDQDLKVRQKKAKTEEEHIAFVKKYEKSPRFNNLSENIEHLIEESGGCIKFENLICFLPQEDNFKKEEVLFFLQKECSEEFTYLFVDDKIIDPNVYELDEHSDIVKYLKQNPKELLYALFTGHIDDTMIEKQFGQPQSEFFKALNIDKKHVIKSLYETTTVNNK